MVSQDMGSYSIRTTILAILFSLILSAPVCAGAKNNGDPAESYSRYEPFLADCTGYLPDNDVGSHGDPVQDGMIAGRPAWYGMTIVIYEAEPQEDGSYKIGSYIETAQILDTGYGSSTGDGVQSRIREDKSSRGTIEVGRSIDKLFFSIKDAKKWMEFTGGHVFIQLIEAEG